MNSMNEKTIPHNFRVSERTEYTCGQIIELGWYETVDGIDERAMVVYNRDKIDNVITYAQ